MSEDESCHVFSWAEEDACYGLAQIGIEGKEKLVHSVLRKLSADPVACASLSTDYVLDFFWVPGRVEIMVLLPLLLVILHLSSPFLSTLVIRILFLLPSSLLTTFSAT